MKKSTKTLLIVGGGSLAALVILPQLLNKGEGQAGASSPITNLFGGGSGGGLIPDALNGVGGAVTGAASGIGDFLSGMLSGQGIAGGSGGGGGGIGDFLAGLFAPRDLFGGSATPGGSGQPGGVPNQAYAQNPSFWTTPIVPKTGNSFLDATNGLGQAAMSLAKAGVVGAGIYAGSKVAMPILTKVAPNVANILNKPLGALGRTSATNAVKTAASTTSKSGGILSKVAAIAKTPVSKAFATPLGAIGSTVAVAGAAYTGWQIGSWFNTTTPGKALIEKSGNLGAKFGGTKIGSSLFGAAQVNQKTAGSALAKVGLTTAQVQSYFKSHKGASVASMYAFYGVKQPGT